MRITPPVKTEAITKVAAATVEEEKEATVEVGVIKIQNESKII